MFTYTLKAEKQSLNGSIFIKISDFSCNLQMTKTPKVRFYVQLGQLVNKKIFNTLAISIIESIFSFQYISISKVIILMITLLK